MIHTSCWFGMTCRGERDHRTGEERSAAALRTAQDNAPTSCELWREPRAPYTSATRTRASSSVAVLLQPSLDKCRSRAQPVPPARARRVLLVALDLDPARRALGRQVEDGAVGKLGHPHGHGRHR
eukprot:7385294-Prymnesium_polylepis.2